jgi:hypothetical protein
MRVEMPNLGVFTNHVSEINSVSEYEKYLSANY